MADKLTKQAALNAGDIFDKAAETAKKLAQMGVITDDIHKKFAYQCDLLSDHTARRAGIDVRALAKQALTGDDVFDEGKHIGEDPEQIGEEKSGPKEQEGDESYMNSEFSQQENRELREKQQGGELGNDHISPDQQSPTPGRQAADVTAALEQRQKLASLYLDINKAAARCASSESEALKGLSSKLAKAGINVLQFQTRLMEGSESDERVAGLVRAAGHVLPHLASDVPEAAASKLARMVDLVAGFAAKA